jgi:hypothetical protein
LECVSERGIHYIHPEPRRELLPEFVRFGEAFLFSQFVSVRGQFLRSARVITVVFIGGHTSISVGTNIPRSFLGALPVRVAVPIVGVLGVSEGPPAAIVIFAAAVPMAAAFV